MQRIGRYEVEAEIGRGAMGVVYRARDPELDRTLAVKTYSLPPGLDEDKQREYRERFQREARAAAALSDPGIVTVFDAGEDDESGLPFIAMEYVAGESLDQVLKREGILPLPRVLKIAERVVSGLSAAHAAGIVHRDIKPANILVHDTEDVIKIADFGVARVRSSTLTQSGSSVGSPAYMSPEQIQGNKVDHRSDLFSLAVILYELLSGVRPFAGDDLTGMVYSVVHETPIPVSRRCPELGVAFDRFFDRALAKDPSERYSDGESFWEALSRAAEDPEGEVDPAATMPRAPLLADRAASDGRRSRRGLLVLAGVAGLTLLFSGWALLFREDAHLRIAIKSSVDGKLALQVDGEGVYQRTLTSAPSGVKKSGLLKTIKRTVTGSGHEEFETLIDVRPGVHEIEATLIPDEGAPSQDTVVVDLEPGETRRLKLVASGKQGAAVSLRVD